MNLPSTQTLILFKKLPSLVSGVASIVDFSNLTEKYNISKTEQEADYKALLADWKAIGIDMQNAIHEYAQNAKQPA